MTIETYSWPGMELVPCADVRDHQSSEVCWCQPRTAHQGRTLLHNGPRERRDPSVADPTDHSPHQGEPE